MDEVYPIPSVQAINTFKIRVSLIEPGTKIDRFEDDLKIRKWPFGLVISLPLLLTGCATLDSSVGQVTPISSMSPGMSMAPGQTMAGASSTPVTPPAKLIVNASGPSKSAKMICGSETRTNVASLLGLSVSPQTRTNWADNIYTCTFKLPIGSLVIAVKELPDLPKARIYFEALRVQLRNTKPVTGMANLGFPAFETTKGTVVFLKDNKTLEVDASALPPQVGSEGSSPSDFAFTIATDILACWTGG